MRFHERLERLRQLLQNVPSESEYQTVAALTNTEQLEYMPWLTQMALNEAYDSR
jgi:hypothetical protein